MPDDRSSTSNVVARLTAVNGLVMVTGLLTGPLLARALGPDGRGAYAAVVVPLTVAGALLTFGMPAFAARRAADGGPSGSLVVCSTLILMPFVALSVVGAPWLSSFLSEGREAIRIPLLVGFLLMPITLFGQLSIGIINGKALWTRLALTGAIPAALGLLGTVTLYVFDLLTVESASALAIGGGLLAILPAITSLRREGPFRFDRAMARQALRFGPVAWLWQLGSLTNARLDQVLMVPLTSPRQLGFYAVAVTAASVSTIFLAALGPALLPKIAAGAHEMAPPAFRRSVITAAAGAVVVGLLAPFALPLLFGGAFRSAVPMLEILLVAGIPATGVQVLSYALLAADRPQWAAAAEAIAVLITLPGLVLVLPAYGGVGAALVSLVAYSLALGVLLVGARRRFGFPLGVFLVPRRADATYLVAVAIKAVRRAGEQLRLLTSRSAG